MQDNTHDKLTRASNAHLIGICQQAIEATKYQLGRSFEGGKDHEFADLAKRFQKEIYGSEPKGFTKKL